MRRSTQQPDWMEALAAAERKRFHMTEADVWVGEVDHTKIKGWLGNPRTEMHARQFEETFMREPSDEEMYELILADDDKKEGLNIRELAKSILQSGVRVPIVLTRDGKLLDGNRRYYANLHVYRQIASEKDRPKFRTLPAIVLADEVAEGAEDAIITEYNFASDFRQEWPYYVKAFRVYRDHVHGLSKQQLEAKYSVPWRYLSKWIKAAELCDQFLEHHDRDFPAERYAYDHFILFDEMMRGYPARFQNRAFREAIFDVLLADYGDGNHRFRASRDVLHLDEIYDSKEAWDVLVTRKGKDALSEAETLVKYDRIEGNAEATPKLKRLVSSMEKTVSTRGIDSVDPELLTRFHELAEQMPGEVAEPRSRVEKMVGWLDGMTSLQMASLDKETLGKLQGALERVLKMAGAVGDLEQS